MVMAAAIFPKIDKRPAKVMIVPRNKGRSHTTRDGGEISQAIYTRTVYDITVEYTKIRYADYERILDFFSDVIYGEARQFEWTCDDPLSKWYNRVFMVRMSDVSQFNYQTPYYWSGTIKMWGTLKNA